MQFFAKHYTTVVRSNLYARFGVHEKNIHILNIFLFLQNHAKLASVGKYTFCTTVKIGQIE